LAALSALLLASAAQAQPGKKNPISKDGLIKAVKINGLPTSELVQNIESRGVAFQMTPAIEQELKSVGGQPEVIEAARNNYRTPEVATTPTETYSSGPSKPRNNGAGPPVPPGPALSKNEIITMLQGGISSARVEQFVETRGVTFALDTGTTSEIKAAGGDRSLIGAITEKGTTTTAYNPGGGGEAPERIKTGPDYDDYIDKIQASVSYGDWNSAISNARLAIQLDPSQPTAYSYLGQGMLYGRNDFAGAEQAMRLALERGGSAAFRIYHDHDGSFNQYCVGSFFVTKTGVSFRADDGADTFEAQDTNIKEAKTNGWVGVQLGAFHIKPIQKIIGRDNFNFAPGSRNRAESQLIINLIQGYR
jgi:hypothetical protein